MVEVANALDDQEPSAWVRRWSHLVPPGPVLDLACGRGRHLRWFAQRGHPVVGVDRSAQALAAIGLPAAACETVLADIEAGPWPLPGRRFSAVVVTHYLWRPLMPHLIESLAEAGVLIYETFAQGQESLGRPSRPEFLLRPGELIEICQGLRIVAFEDGHQPQSAQAPARFIQRIAAVRGLGVAMLESPL
ncbi:MAG: class I SAM-dependent methyltransferase [Betaproteobacteria bacterium]|nr:class I SAM-dependent methyltransferase [Betaproteobacteria bacterium]